MSLARSPKSRAIEMQKQKARVGAMDPAGGIVRAYIGQGNRGGSGRHSPSLSNFGWTGTRVTATRQESTEPSQHLAPPGFVLRVSRPGKCGAQPVQLLLAMVRDPEYRHRRPQGCEHRPTLSGWGCDPELCACRDGYQRLSLAFTPIGHAGLHIQMVAARLGDPAKINSKGGSCYDTFCASLCSA
jgi:hypothetical protein